MRLKIFVLAALAVVLLAVGAWMVFTPLLERRSDTARQNELLDLLDSVITDGNGVADGEYAAPPPYEAEYNPLLPIFIYEETPIAEYVYIGYSDYELETYYLPIYEPEPLPLPEPLDLSIFPQGIVPLGIMAIESIDLRLPVMEGVKEPELRIAPGRVSETSAIGDVGNAVIAGHRNLTFGSMFNRLGEVEVGDIIQFQGLDGRVMEFEVFEILVILPADQIAFIQPQDMAIITLYTCTPIREATHRLVIRAKKI